MATDRIKPQPTLNGYNAWVFRQLLEAKGIGPAQLAEWIIDRWIDSNGQVLSDEFDVQRRDYRKLKKIVQHPNSRSSNSN